MQQLKSYKLYSGERENDHKQPANANQIVYIENTLQQKDPRIPLQEAIYVGQTNEMRGEAGKCNNSNHTSCTRDSRQMQIKSNTSKTLYSKKTHVYRSKKRYTWV